MTYIFSIPLPHCWLIGWSFSEVLSKACVKLIQAYIAACRFIVLSI